MAISKIENNSLASGVPSTAKLPAGTVLQVVNATTTTQVSSTSSTFADTGLTASITPTSSTSKILVFVMQSSVQKNSSDTVTGLRLLRNSTVVLNFDTVGDTSNAAVNNTGGSGCSYLDSPATTSAVTYKTQFNNAASAGATYVQAATSASTITLMEIAA